MPTSVLLSIIACTTVASIEVAPAEVSLTSKGATTTLTATGQDQYAKEASTEGILWESADPAVATVDAAGVVTAVSSGKTRVTGTIDKAVGVSVVNVEVLGAGSVRVPAFLETGSTGTLAFSLTNDKGERYVGETPACIADPPTVATLADTTITAVGPGLATVTCKVGAVAFEGKLAVLSKDYADLALSADAVAQDWSWIQQSIGLVKQVKDVGVDKVQITRFTLRRGKHNFDYDLCGTREEVKMNATDFAGNTFPLVITGPCKGKTFDAKTPPWTGTPWLAMLVEAQASGQKLGKNVNFTVSANDPAKWTLNP